MMRKCQFPRSWDPILTMLFGKMLFTSCCNDEYENECNNDNDNDGENDANDGDIDDVDDSDDKDDDT